MTSSGNFCTMNPLVGTDGTLSNGNLYLNSVSYPANLLGTMGVTSGKWYFEARCTDNYGAYDSFGVIVSDNYTYKDQVGNSITESISWHQLDTVRIDGADQGTTTPSLYNTATKIVGCALDLDNNKVYFHGNNTYVNSHNPSTGSGGFSIPSGMQGKHFLPMMGTNAVGAAALRRANFGQDSSFGGDETAQGNADGNGHGDFYYAPPTGFLAMCSANLPVSADIDPAQTDDDYPSKQFGVVTYTGTGSATTISGLGFKPDLIWAKRTDSSQRHYLVDSNRGFTKYLHSEDTYSEGGPSSTGITSANSDGFVIGGGLDYVNYSSATYVAWCWRANGGTTSSNSNGSITATVQANTKAGFSIATYTSPGSGTNHTVGHGLSDVDFIITKDRSSTFNWYCFHKSVPDKTYRLNTGAEFSYSNWSMGSSTWGSEDGYTHNSTDDFVAYCWQNVEGFQKFGTYVGNGNSDGPFIYTGFRPRLIFTLQKNSTSGWRVRDTARDTKNPSDSIVWWNRSDRQYDSSGYNFDILSNGFKVRNTGSDFNTSGTTYLFGAWGDVPFKYNNTF